MRGLSYKRHKEYGKFNVRVAKYEDLSDIANLDVTEFHKSTVELEGLQEWFKAYPRGAYVLEDREAPRKAKIVGAFGFWPITEGAYKRIIEGKMNESEITGSHIRHPAKNSRYRYWYLADIIVSHEYRKRSLSKSRPGLLLVREALFHWAKFKDFADDIDVCAIAAGEEGEGAKLLQDFGFVTAKTRHGEAVKCESGDTVYLRSISAAERTTMTERINRLFERRSWLDFLRTAAGWLILIGVAGGFALELQKQYIEKKLGLILEQWNLQMVGLAVCGLSLLFLKNKEMRMTIVAAGLLPIAFKLLKVL